MKLICGLGNPGEKYEGTRHNAGFMFVDAFAKKHDFPAFQEKWDAWVSEKGVGGEKVLLMKPKTFMNLSGASVAECVNFYKIPLEHVLLAYDDVDLPLGEIRFRNSGSAGTHNGMKSVIEALGTENFPRIRFGIESRGRFAPEQMDLAAFVLTPFIDEERGIFIDSLRDGIALIEKRLA